MLQKYSRELFLFSFLLFICSAIYGLILRWNFAFPSNMISYKNLVQGHSHVAFLGWGYLTTIGLIFKFFISEENLKRKVYSITLILSVITISLMLISFLLSGYKAFSIVLLSVFGITTYVLSFYLLKDLKEKSTSAKFIKYGVYYYLFSSLATWFLAFVIVTQGKTNLYYNSVYFYLHFLYNGFFVFCIFGILFKILESKKVTISIKYQKYFFNYLNIAIIPAYFLSVLWSIDNLVFNSIGLLSAILQLIALVYLIKIVQQATKLLNWDKFSSRLLKFAMIAFSIKIVAQLLSAFPYFVRNSIALKPYLIIGYLHLFTLAFMSVSLILILIQANVFNFKSVSTKIGLNLFLVGILITEILLFSQGGFILIGFSPINYFNIIMLVFSSLIVIGLILIFLNQYKLPYKSVK